MIGTIALAMGIVAFVLLVVVVMVLESIRFI